MRKINLILVCVSALLLSGVSASEAMRVGQIEFDDMQTINEVEMVLVGSGLGRFGMEKFMSVGLYLPKKAKPHDVLTGIQKSLEVAYLQNVGREELIDLFKSTLSKNLSDEMYSNLEAELNQFFDLFPEVEASDRFKYTYIPQKGFSMEINGVDLDLTLSADFAKAFFSMYFGQKPINTRLKSKILGRKQY